MQHRVWIAAALAGCFTLSTARAAQPLEQRWEAGIDVGRAEHALSHSSGDDNQIDETDSALRVFGSYYFTPSVALRVGYADLGSVTFVEDSFREDYLQMAVEQRQESTASAFTVGGVFSLPINQVPVVFGVELGMAHWNVEYDVTDIRRLDAGGTDNQSASYSSSDLGFYYGGSVVYQFTPTFGAGLSALWYVMEPEIDGDDRFELVVQTLNLNALMRF